MNKQMIYIASSWKHQHGVEALTSLLEAQGFFVISWIRNNYDEGFASKQAQDFEQWVITKDAEKAFLFDTGGAMNCNLFIYYGNAGKDAAAECGMAFAKKIPMVALYSKGEDFGLMRKMFSHWFVRMAELLAYTQDIITSNKE